MISTSTDQVARVLILRGQPERARTILARIYPRATPSKLDKKVDEMVHSVQMDSTLGGVSLKQKLNKLFYTGSNRRALGESSSVVIEADDQWLELAFRRHNSFAGSIPSCTIQLRSSQLLDIEMPRQWGYS